MISRGEGGVGIAEDVEFIRDVMYKESVWMKVRGGRWKEVVCICQMRVVRLL